MHVSAGSSHQVEPADVPNGAVRDTSRYRVNVFGLQAVSQPNDFALIRDELSSRPASGCDRTALLRELEGFEDGGLASLVGADEAHQLRVDAHAMGAVAPKRSSPWIQTSASHTARNHAVDAGREACCTETFPVSLRLSGPTRRLPDVPHERRRANQRVPVRVPD